MDDSRLRFRVFVAGRLVNEQWIDCALPGADELAAASSARQEAIAEAAAADGEVWMLEVFDPAQPEDRAYFRMGTDDSMMWDPLRVTSPRQVADLFLPGDIPP